MMKNICVKEHAYGTYQSDRRSRRRCHGRPVERIFHLRGAAGRCAGGQGTEENHPPFEQHARRREHHHQRLAHRRRRRSVHAHRRAGQGRRGLRRAGRVHLRRVHRADDLCRKPRREHRSGVPEHRQALHLRRRGPEGSAHLLFQHQGADRQQVRHAEPGAVPRGRSARRHRHRHRHPLLRRVQLPHHEPAAVLHQRLRQRHRGLHPRHDRRSAQERAAHGAAAGVRAHQRYGHPLLVAARPHARDRRGAQRGALGAVA